MSDLIDALINVDPEPCQTCDSGIQYIMCWDGKGRCRNCVQETARKLGWDQYAVDWDWDRKKAPEPVKRTLALPKDPTLDL